MRINSHVGPVLHCCGMNWIPRVRMICALAVGCVLAGTFSSVAANFYVAQSAQGANTGADAADAHSLAWLNTSSNWGTGTNQIGPGGTVYLCGIISNALTIQAAGLPGSPLTIYFAPNARFSAPTWTGNIINDSGYSYVTFDGGSNGVMEATASGSGLAYSNTMTAIALTGCSGVIVRNLTFQNFYVMASGGITSTDATSSGSGVILTGSGFGNDVITNCVFHDMFSGVAGAYGAGCFNLTMTHCTAYNCNWGGAMGDANASGTLNGMTVDHCHFYNWLNWDNAYDNHHHNGFFTWAESGGSVSNVTYVDNYVGPGYGVQNSYGLFAQGNVVNVVVYNNIFDASDGTAPADGLLYVDLEKITTASSVYACNNTFIGGAAVNVAGINLDGDIYGGNPSHFYLLNNVFVHNYYGLIWFYNSASTLVCDTNDYYGCSANAFASSASGSGGGGSLASWQAIGYDLHSLTVNPDLNISDQPQPGSPLIGAGENLTALGITNDYLGNPRPATGPWTIGAYQGASVLTNAAILVTPSSQNFGTVTIGASSNLTFTVQNAGGGTLSGSASVAAPFGVVAGGTYSLTNAQSQIVTVGYTPTVAGANLQTVTFSGGGGAAVALSGTAVTAPTRASSFATNLYVAQTAVGANSGLDAADACSVAWLNTATNWGLGANQIGPGCTVHLCGTISSPLTIQAGGTLGNPITLLFEPNASLSAPTWSGGVINDAGYSYLTIDGGSNGLIQATANGSGLAYSNNITALALSGCSGVTVKNLTIQNLYVMTGTALTGMDHTTYGAGVILSGAGLANVLVTNCVFHDLYEGFSAVYGAGCSNLTFSHCTAYDCNWGGMISDASGTSTLFGLAIDHCHAYNFQNWDNSFNGNRHIGVYALNVLGGWMSNVTCSANYVGPGFGAQSTAGIFVNGNVFNVLAANNILDASDASCPASGLFYLCVAGLTNPPTSWILNNTFVGAAVGLNILNDASGSVPSTVVCLNNEFYTNSYYPVIVHYGAYLTLVSDTNNYYGQWNGGFVFSANGSGGGNTFTQWNAFGYDLHSTTLNPLLTGVFAPQTNSPVLAAGANLTPLAITYDFAGNLRPATGNWTLGAYQAGGVTRPSVPQNFHIVEP